MTENAALWLSVFGAITGCIGMFTGIAAAIYARRQAIAAEGPTKPDVECDHHNWDAENPDWYAIQLVVRNRTDRSWVCKSAKVIGLTGAKLLAQNQIPNLGTDFEPRPMNLREIDLTKITKVATPHAAVAPAGTKSSQYYLGSQPVSYDTLFAYIPSRSGARSISIDLIFEDKAEIPLVKKITLKRRLMPKTIAVT